MNLDVISNIRNVIGDVLALGPENFYLGIEMKHFNKLLMATIFVLLSPLVHADFDYALYSGGFNQVPDFTGLTPVKVGKRLISVTVRLLIKPIMRSGLPRQSTSITPLIMNLGCYLTMDLF